MVNSLKIGITKSIAFLIFITISSSIPQKVYAGVDDCIDYLVDRGLRAREAREACSKVTDNDKKSKLTSAQKMCFSAKKGNGETLRYENGEVMTYSAGRVGSTWYYPNGKVMTYSAGRIGSTWYYSNGKVITYNAGNPSATWYYSNGKVMTHNVGSPSATWYYSNGNVMTHNIGNPSATWYNPDGSVLSYRGLSTPVEISLYPCNYIE